MLAAQVNPNTDTDVNDGMAAAKALGRTLHVTKVAPDGDVEPPVAALLKLGVKALFVAPQADFRMWRQQLVLLAARHALPTSFSSSDHVTAGGLMSYGRIRQTPIAKPETMRDAFSRVRGQQTYR